MIAPVDTIITIMVAAGWMFCYKPLQELNRVAVENAARQPQYAKDE